jgi:hypothetical protein
MRTQRQQVRECVRSYEKALTEYAATGCRMSLEGAPARRKTEFQRAHVVSVMQW